MRNVILVAFVAGLLGAMFGAAAVLVARPDEAREQAGGGPTSAQLESAFRGAVSPSLDRLSGQIDGLRDDLAQRAAGAASGASPGPGSASPGSSRRKNGSRRVDPTHAAPPGSAPSPDYERVVTLRGFEESPKLRRQWLFTTDEEALRVFGTPDDVWIIDGGEIWHYEQVTAVDSEGDATETSEFELQFSRGRLVHVRHD